MKNIFFDSTESMIRTIVITILAYVSLIVFLRIAGKRTLSKMNAFDFVVTIALGSTLATVMLNKDVALLDGMLAFVLLIALQYIITYLSVRYSYVNSLVKATPTLLLYKGNMLHKAMQKERVTEDEILAIVRQNGSNALNEVFAVILETEGTLTVLKSGSSLESETLKNVQSNI